MFYKVCIRRPQAAVVHYVGCRSESRVVAGRRRMPRERIAEHLSERAPTAAGIQVCQVRCRNSRYDTSVDFLRMTTIRGDS